MCRRGPWMLATLPRIAPPWLPLSAYVNLHWPLEDGLSWPRQGLSTQGPTHRGTRDDLLADHTNGGILRLAKSRVSEATSCEDRQEGCHFNPSGVVMHFKNIRRFAAIALAALAGIGVSATPSASAEPATTLATRAQLILDCLEDGYVPGYIEKTYSQTTGAYYTLDCGRQDPDANLSFGVLHVDNGHTIPRSLAGAQQFYLCFVRMIQYGVTDQRSHWNN